MERSLVYLDYNATTPVRPAVIEAVAEALALGGNPSSVHGAGRRAAAMLHTARDKVAALAGVSPRAVIFTSGATEANNAIIEKAGFARILIAAIEHDSVRESAKHGPAEVATIGVDGDGVLDLAALEAALKGSDAPTLVSVMTANNETGVIEPVAEIARLCRRYGAHFHTDAVQAAGKIDLFPIAEAADFISLSAHKLGGPAGVGALIIKDDRIRIAIQRGGGQEWGFRAGTENLPGIVGFGKAAEIVLAEMAEMSRLARLRDCLEVEIKSIDRDVKIAGESAARLANTSCLTMPHVAAETQVMAFDLAGIAVSAGAACSSGKIHRSHVLEAMGYDAADAEAAIRVSLGWQSQENEVRRFIDTWREIRTRARKETAAVA